MNKSVYQELLNHVINKINDLELEDFEELHHTCFNEDYYIIGYYQASEWLKNHNIDPFEAIADVIEWQQENFGETFLNHVDINSEKIVNLYVYIKGEELLSNFDLDQSKDDLLSELREELE